MSLELSPLQLLDGGASRRPLLIAGPCSAESEQQVLQTAKGLVACGVKVYRAGLWKPRTKPGGFEGVGAIGLPWLQRVREEVGMKVATEVATPLHVEAALGAGLDVLWVGARTMANPFAVQEVAEALRGVDVPLLCKNPVNPDLELWVGGLERFAQVGCRRLGVIHRGFSTYEKRVYRNDPMWRVPIELHRRIPELPIICDPSHMGGVRELIAPLSQQALDLGFDGLMIESHCCPTEAWSDAQQQVTPEELQRLVEQLVVRSSSGRAESLSKMRREIDQLDNDLIALLSERMEVARQIGRFKEHHDMTVLQPHRYSEVMADRMRLGKQAGMSDEFVKALFRAVHEESVRQQLDVLRGKEGWEECGEG